MSDIVHLCIDFQRGYRGSSPAEWNAMRSNIEQLANELAEKGVPTIYVAYIPPEEGLPKRRNASTSIVSNTRPLLDPVDNLPTYAEVKGKLANSKFGDFDLDISPQGLVAIKSEFSAFNHDSLLRYIQKKEFKKIF